MGPSFKNTTAGRHLISAVNHPVSGTDSGLGNSALGPNFPDAASQFLVSVEKAQWIRLLDAFVIGPAIIYYGRQADSNFGRLFMTAIGVGTIVYNGANYLANKDMPVIEIQANEP